MNIKYVFLFSLQRLSKTFPILRGIQRDVVENVDTSSCKVPVILLGFSWNSSFLDTFSIKCQISSFIKIRPLGVGLFHVARQTDATIFRNFAKPPNKAWTDRWPVYSVQIRAFRHCVNISSDPRMSQVRSDASLQPFQFRSAARDVISQTLKGKMWNSTNRYFIRIRTKLLFIHKDVLLTTQDAFRTKHKENFHLTWL